jgi:drug/metabolite transporter (DMT)-like permease
MLQSIHGAYTLSTCISGFLGALICASAGDVDSYGEQGSRALGQSYDLQMFGNMLAFASSIGTAIYLVIAKRMRPNVRAPF